jgi:hypothetical protein
MLFEREELEVSDGTNGWAHSWFGGQTPTFFGPNVIPGNLLRR